METRTTCDKAKEAITKAVYEDRLSKDELVDLIKHAGFFAGITTVPEYAQEQSISIPGAAQSKYAINLFGRKFIARND